MNLNFARTIQSGCAKAATIKRVFPGLQIRRCRASARMGDRFPACALCDFVLLQLLVSVIDSDDRPQLESPELFGAGAKFSLPGCFVSFHAHRGCSDILRAAAWLSSGVFPVFSCNETQRSALPVGHYSFVGKLLSPRLCVENNFGYRWGAQRGSTFYSRN